MTKRDWDKIYKEKGEIQTEVSGLVRDSLNLLKKRKVKKVLDLCFGTGRHAIFLAENGFEVYGIDISEKGKEITEKKIKEKNLKNVYLQVADMHQIPFEDKFFDAILAIYSLAHNDLEGLEQTISELERVLKPKGMLITTLISKNDPRCGTGEKIEPGTFINLDDSAEKDVPHRFSDEKEFKNLFSNFKIIKLKENFDYSQRRQAECVHWELIGEKI